jgi:hypothetical protein
MRRRLEDEVDADSGWKRLAAAALGAVLLGLGLGGSAAGGGCAARPPPPHDPPAPPAAQVPVKATPEVAAAQVPPAAPWQVAPSGGLVRPVMPDRSLDPPAGVVPVLMLYGQGVQRYVCKAKDAGAAKSPAATAPSAPSEALAPKAAFEWTLKEPVAKLFDGADHEVGAHSAGPTWRLADGSQAVKKKLVASVPALQFDGVPWLLIEIESSGKGGLAGTTYVQRLDTVGGAAPATGCGADHAGATTDVEYRATYLFYAPRPKR